jgi:histidinol phosphatase-like enzyme
VLLFRHAAAELGLDLGRSWWVGDKLSDLVPSLAFGGQAILVRTGEGSRHESEASRAGFRVAADVNEAVAVVLAEGRANGTKGNGERGMGNGGKRQTKSGEEER